MKSVVHKTTRREGGQPGNRNASKRVAMPEWLNLEEPASVIKFIRTILIPYTLAGRIGTRQSSAITTACKVLLDYDADLQHLEEMKEGLARMEEEMKEFDAKLQQHRAAMKPVGSTTDDTIKPSAS
ncbi:MAG: hypothetical protein ABSF82_05545 [Candidatus Bathyarchaeia archaeon]